MKTDEEECVMPVFIIVERIHNLLNGVINEIFK